MTMSARSIVMCAAATLLIASVAISATGHSIWPLAVDVWLLLTLVLAQRLGWALAFAGGLLALLVAESFLLRITPVTGVPLDVTHTVVWGSVGAALTMILATARKPLRLPSRSSIGVAAAAASAPLVAALAYVAAMRFATFDKYSWAMNNDAVWTTMSARHIVTDGGVETAVHMNSSPLMSALMAVGSSIGRSTLAEVDLLRHDIAEEALIWVLVFLMMSLLVGLIVARSVSPGRPILRLVLAYFAGFFPFGWYVAGYMLMYGFYSATLALVLLLAVLVVGREAFRSPVAGVSLLLLGSTAMLATWAPLVVVPGVFAALVFVRNWRVFLSRAHPWRLAAWLFAAVQLLTYLVLVTVPDFGVDGEALANGGGTPSVSAALFGAFFVGALVSSLLVARAGRSTLQLVWIVALGVGLLLGLGVLLWQTRNSGTPWSYYPSKFAWMATIVLFVVSASNVASLLSSYYRKRLAFTAVGLSGVLVGTALFIPMSSELTGDDLRGPFVNTVRSVEPTAVVTDLLFSFSAPSEKNLMSKYLATPPEDMRENLWLLQLSAEKSNERIRYFSYVMDTTDPRSVCTAIRAWGGGVTVRTTDPDWERALRSVCRDTQFTVVVS